MAYLKLNQLHLHFSDDQGFRIESSSHPEIVSRAAPDEAPGARASWRWPAATTSG